MKIIMTIMLGLLILLAAASGLAKIMLMPQEIEFHRPFGFSDPLLIVFGLVQFLCGLALILLKTRRIAAVLLATTFLLSAVLLWQAGNLPLTAVTLVCVLLLGLIAKSTTDQTGQII